MNHACNAMICISAWYRPNHISFNGSEMTVVNSVYDRFIQYAAYIKILAKLRKVFARQLVLPDQSLAISYSMTPGIRKR